MEKIKLIDICNPKQWKTIATGQLSKQGDFPVYGANGIIGFYKEFNHEDQTVLITCRGATCGNVHISLPKSYINGNAMALDNLDESVCLKEYLYYFLSYYDMSKIISGTAQPQITIQGLKKINVKICPIEEQKNIIDKLNIVKKIIKIKKEQIIDLDNIIKSQFVEMFGDPVLNEKQWKKAPLETECNIITGNTPSRNKKEYYGDFIEWIKSDNINTPSDYITQAEEYLSKEGENVGRTINKDSILMTCIAGSISCIGNVAMTDRKVAFNQQINGIETLKNNTIFMYVQFLLSKQYIQSTINMSLKGILSKGKLSELEFVFPPIELQNQFADIVKQIDKQKFESEIELRKLQKNIFYKWGR